MPPPKVVGRTREAVADSRRIASALDRLAVELSARGYEVFRVPYLSPRRRSVDRPATRRAAAEASGTPVVIGGPHVTALPQEALQHADAVVVGEGEACWPEVVSDCESGRLYEVQVTVQTAFPGTPLYERLKREGRLIEDQRWDKCTLFDINFRPTHMTSEQLVDGFKHFVQELYSEEFTAWRRGNFRRQLRDYISRKGAASDEA